MEEKPTQAPGLSTDMEGKELALWLKKAWQGLGDLKVTQGRGKGLGCLIFLFSTCYAWVGGPRVPPFSTVVKCVPCTSCLWKLSQVQGEFTIYEAQDGDA